MAAIVLCVGTAGARGQVNAGVRAEDPNAPDVGAIIALPRSEMADVVNRFQADQTSLMRRYPVQASPARRERLRIFYAGWEKSLDAIAFDSLSLEGKVDWVLLRNLVRRQGRQLEMDRARREQMNESVPFVDAVLTLAEGVARPESSDPAAAARTLDSVKKQAEGAAKAFGEKLKDAASKPAPSDCKRLLDVIEGVRSPLRQWNGFFAEYDPEFGWWCDEPYKAADRALEAYAKLVREKGVGITPENPSVIVGMPIGREELLADLEFEMIPYTPEELIAIAEREFAWCEEEMRKAAGEMGLGEDRMAAIEKVKGAHVAPGEQPALIRAMADEAIAYLKEHDLITVPPLAEETWRMEMMSAERQMVAPFFLGGESIIVAFPTQGMSQEHKMMSLRGNNRHFSHAAVFHELIPGHNLQSYSRARYNTHRDMFNTAFWTEGWCLYWEMLMWDRGFNKTPEDRVGALFWRSHRCARIICSLKYHLGEMTGQEWVDYLVDKVGHERANAEGEVRRSVSGGYGPLYQVAYMIGGLQFRTLHKEIVGGGKMTDRAFHDMVMRANNMPVEMVRALVSGEAPEKEFATGWKFDGGRAAGEDVQK